MVNEPDELSEIQTSNTVIIIITIFFIQPEQIDTPKS